MVCLSCQRDVYKGDGHTGRVSKREEGRIIDARRTHCAAVAVRSVSGCQPPPHPPHPPRLLLTCTHSVLSPSKHTMESNSALPDEEAMHQLRFPPFPQVPDGVELIPFHLFRPSGIRVPIDDEDDVEVEDGQRAPAEMVERDGLGILTIALRVKHTTDNMEKKKKRKRKNAAQQMQVAEKPKTWWEIWEEIEEIRRNAYDRRVHPLPSHAVLRVRALNGVV
jgi:hypothetical protein